MWIKNTPSFTLTAPYINQNGDRFDYIETTDNTIIDTSNNVHTLGYLLHFNFEPLSDLFLFNDLTVGIDVVGITTDTQTAKLTSLSNLTSSLSYLYQKIGYLTPNLQDLVVITPTIENTYITVQHTISNIDNINSLKIFLYDTAHIQSIYLSSDTFSTSQQVTVDFLNNVSFNPSTTVVINKTYPLFDSALNIFSIFNNNTHFSLHPIQYIQTININYDEIDIVYDFGYIYKKIYSVSNLSGLIHQNSFIINNDLVILIAS